MRPQLMPENARERIPTDQEAAELVAAGKFGELAERNLPLAKFVAHRHGGKLGFNDAFGAAQVGLMEAARAFDPSKGVKFQTYAVRVMKCHIQHENRRTIPVIVMPGMALNLMLRVRKGEFWTRQSRESQLKSAAKCEASQALQRTQLLPEIEPAATEPDEVADAELIDVLRDRLAELNEREQQVIRARFGIGTGFRTLAQVGGELCITRERVRQIEALVIEKLRSRLGVAI